MQARIPQQHAERFITSGKARVGFHNTETGNHFWYHVLEIGTSTYNVYWKNPTRHNPYIGQLRTQHMVQFHAINTWQSAQVFAWMWKAIRELSVPDKVHILHTGVCGHCGRILTDPESIEVGIGPSCRKKLGIK